MSDRARRGLGAAVLCAASLLAFGGAPAGAAPGDQCARAGQSVPLRSWATDLLEPKRAWPLSTGTGVAVAVLGSGVDAHQPLLRGRVAAGYDAITGGAGNTDCLGFGTQVASTVVGTGAGVAPSATIVPVRVTGEPGSNLDAAVSPVALAAGIRWATGHGADVIDVSVWVPMDSRLVRDAVAEALAAGVTVVAAAGDSDGSAPAVTWPAAYPGVVGVGAIDATGQPAAGVAAAGPLVDVLAPGVNVPAAQRGHGVVAADGSALAAGFVAGTAALVRARWRHEAGPSAADRLLAAASPTPGGGPGIVNPYLAVTTRMADAPARAMPAMAAPAGDAAAQAARAARHRAVTRAVDLTAVALGVLAATALLAVGARRARRLRWRPAYAATPAPVPTPVEPEPVPALFDEPVT